MIRGVSSYCRRGLAASLVVLMAGAAASGQGLIQPNGLSTKGVLPLDQVSSVRLAPLDMGAIEREDAERDAAGEPTRFAIPHEVRIIPENDGTWERLDADRWMWRLRIRAEEADSINLGFTTWHMPEGGMMFVYATDGTYSIRPFTPMDNDAHGELWTPVVLSDDITVEVVVHEKQLDNLKLELTSINYGYRGFGELVERSGSCNNDVVCPEGDDWQDEISTVGAISTGGSIFCTGFMVNNTAADLTPYFMTADHCGIGTGNAASLVVYWNFETSTCSGVPDGVLTDFQTGSVHRASFSSSDFTLVELDDDPDPDWEVGFAGWDRRDMSFNDGAVAIHHPQGDEKRISFESDPVVPDTYLGEAPPGNSTHLWVSSWDDGTTEPGSSGSPLFSWDHKVIGQLHGGYASCTDLRGDWYGRFQLSWTGGGSSSTRLSDWLDPLGTGQMTLDTIPGVGMQISPAGNVDHIGVVGGPFTNDPYNYTLGNATPMAINYTVSLGAGSGPILINGGSSAGGTLAASGGSAMLTISVDPSATGLPAGVYSRELIFDDTTNGRQRVLMHTVEIGQTIVSSSPANGLVSGGPVGGPFTATQVYTITSDRPTPVDVQISASHSWISLNGGSGPVMATLTGTGDFLDVTVGFSSDANLLPNGIVNGTVTITNLTSGDGNTSRPVTLDVGRYTYAAVDTPQAINDNSTITSIITVPDTYCIGDVDVELDVTHTYIGDLRVILTSPEGTSVTLHDRSGGSADDIVTTYDDGTNPPDGPGLLADYISEFSAGDWTLTISDNAGQDTGSLNNWTLKIAASGATCPPEATNVVVTVPDTVTSSIQLVGMTIEPTLDYIITSLPTDGTLTDPVTMTDILSVPYTLASMGDMVDYQPDFGYVGDDGFEYKVNDGQDSNVATVDIAVGGPQIVYDFPMDIDPGWSADADWGFGQPTGGGTHNGDPSSGFTGNNVYGYNLNGDYPNNLSPIRYLTTTVLDCTDFTDTTLEFQRWLGVESATYDHANIEVSNDGVNWSTVWEHTQTSAINENGWSLQTYDISADADGEATVYLRWGMGTTDGSVTYPGWNIDDVRIYAVLPPTPLCPGDADGDLDVDFDDLNLVLSNWGTAGPDGDVFPYPGGDGAVDFNDLNEVLSHWNQSCGE